MLVTPEMLCERAICRLPYKREQYIEVDSDSYGRWQRGCMKEGHSVGDWIFDYHSHCITWDEIGTWGLFVVCNEDGWKFMTQVLYENLSDTATVVSNFRLSINHLGSSIFPFRVLQFDFSPGRRRGIGNFFKNIRGSPSQCKKGDVHLIDLWEILIRG